MIEEKPTSLTKAFTQFIKYLEANDPHNENLEVLKRHVSELNWKTKPFVFSY